MNKEALADEIVKIAITQLPKAVRNYLHNLELNGGKESLVGAGFSLPIFYEIGGKPISDTVEVVFMSKILKETVRRLINTTAEEQKKIVAIFVEADNLKKSAERKPEI